MNGDNEVIEAAGNVAKAHEAAAKTDMQAMQTAQIISKNITDTSESVDKMLAINNYYQQSDDVNSAAFSALTQANKGSQMMNSSTTLGELQRNYEGNSAILDGMANQVNQTSTLNKEFKFRAIKHIDYAKSQSFKTYNAKLAQLIDSHYYDHLVNGAAAAANNAGSKNPDFSEFYSSALAIANNPIVSPENRKKINNILTNAKALTATGDNNQLSNTSDDVTQISLDRSAGIKGQNNIIDNMFLYHKRFLGAASTNLTMNPYKFIELKKQQDELNIIYDHLSRSDHIMGDLNAMKSSNGLQAKIANRLLPLLDKGQGDLVIRGLSNNVNDAYNKFQSISSKPNADAALASRAWQDYEHKKVIYAQNTGIPVSKIGTMPQNLLDEAQEIDQKPDSKDYVDLNQSLFSKFNEINGKSPVYGEGQYSYMARIQKYSPKGNPFSPILLSASNPKYQKVVQDNFKTLPNHNDIDKSIGEYIDANRQQLDTIATITQVPFSQVADSFSYTYKNLLNNGMSDSKARDTTTQLMNGFVNNAGFDVDNNYILPSGLLSGMDINKKDAPVVVSKAIKASLSKWTHNMTGRPDGIPEDAWITNRADQVGDPADYTLIYSDGNYYAKNKYNSLKFPVNENMLEVAHNHLRDNKKEREYVMDFSNPLSLINNKIKHWIGM